MSLLKHLVIFVLYLLIASCTKSESGGCSASSLYEISCPTQDSAGTGGDSSTSGGSSTSSGSSSTSGGSGVTPSVTSILPFFGSPSGDDVITITGTNFSTATVKLGSETCSVNTQSSTTIVCTTPKQSVASVDVVVTNLDGESTTVSSAFHYAGSGTYDTTFDRDGLVTLSSINSDTPRGLILQSDGRPVMVGSITSGYAIARFNSNGTLDTSFSLDGIFSADGFTATLGLDISQTSDGKLFILGQTTGAGIVGRFNTNGTLDTSFEIDGYYSQFSGQTVKLESTGDAKVIAIGSLSNDYTLARISTQGNLDSTFENDGIHSSNLGGTEVGKDIVLDSFGRILIAVDKSNTPFAARITTNGMLDTSFDNDGSNSLLVGATTVSMAITLDNLDRLLLAGVSDATAFVVRILTNGILDSTFSTDGLSTVDVPGSTTDTIYGLSVQTNNKIVATGNANNSSFVFRITSDGTLDTSFSAEGDGIFTANLGTTDQGLSVSIQNNGLIVVGLTVDSGFAVARFYP